MEESCYLYHHWGRPRLRAARGSSATWGERLGHQLPVAPQYKAITHRVTMTYWSKQSLVHQGSSSFFTGPNGETSLH